MEIPNDKSVVEHNVITEELEIYKSGTEGSEVSIFTGELPKKIQEFTK